MRKGRGQLQLLKRQVIRVGTAGGLLASALMIWWGIAAVTGTTGVKAVGQVQAESRVMTYQILPAIPVLTITTKEPWELTVSDLTPERIWYNLLTKPGFRWLAIDVMAGLVLVLLAWQASWKLVRWSQATRQVQLPRHDLHQTRPMVFKPGLIVEIAGTVKISTTGGIIYQAWETLTQSGERELALILGKVPGIRIVRV